MTDIQSDILSALRGAEWSTLTQLSERTHIFRRRIEYEMKNLIAAGAVLREIRDHNKRPIGLYRLPEVAIEAT